MSGPSYEGVSSMNGPNYHALHFIVRYGGWLTWLVTTAVALAGVAAWAAGSPALVAAGLGVGGAALGYLVVRSYVELVRVIVDMLLPK